MKSKLLLITAAAALMTAGLSRSLLAGNEPDFYVAWIGHSGAGPVLDPQYAFKVMPRIELGMTLKCGDTDVAGNSSEGAGRIVMNYTGSGTGFTYVRFGGGKNVTAVANPVPSLDTTAFNDVVWSTNFYYNGQLVAKVTPGTYSFSSANTESFKFFKGRGKSSATMKVAYIKMYDDDVLVRDMLPGCKDGEYGMYDFVTDSFYVNTGTGSFTHGDPKAITETVEVSAYPLELGTPEPGYGSHSGFSAGDRATFTAPSGRVAYDGKTYSCTGWELYELSPSGRPADAPYLTGDSAVCEYVHPTPAVDTRLVWKWEVTGDAVSNISPGCWDDPAIWSTGEVPTINDDVSIRSAVYCTNDLRAASLSISPGGSLFFHVRTDTAVDQPVPYFMDRQSYLFEVAGDVSLYDGVLALHGARTPTSITNLEIRIGGNLSLYGASSAGFSAATYAGQDVSITNLYNTATIVDVGGAITVDGQSMLYPYCDEIVGCAVKFKCRSFKLGAKAEVRARERGWYWWTPRDPREDWCQPSRNRYTFARGAGNDVGRIGAGHGGPGSSYNDVSGREYGFKYAPFLPGSPAGGDSGYTEMYENRSGCGRGGGVFWLVVSGKAVINGKITANALTTSWQAASGGSVWIAADEFEVGPFASIDASGGGAGGSTPNAIGGGGRVSFALKVNQEELDALARGEVPGSLVYSEPLTAIECNVSAGAPLASSTVTAGDGTSTFVTRGDEFLQVTVAASGPYATGVTPGYGPIVIQKGQAVAFSAPAYGTDPVNESSRYECLGYVVSNAVAEIASGTGTSFDLTPEESVTVTWLWGEQEYLNYLEIIGDGHVSIDGTEFGPTNIYLKASAPNLLTVVPESGREFLYWIGDMPAGDRFNPSLALRAADQKHLTAVFRTVAERGVRSWRDGSTGDFHNPENWADGIVPGIADTVVVASGTCRIPEYVKIGSLELSGGDIVAARTVARPGYTENNFDITGNGIITGTGALTMGATDGSSQMYNTLNVGGDLLMDGTSSFLIAAGRRTGAYTWDTGCGFVNVAGKFRLDGEATFIPNCEGYTGGGVKTTVGMQFRVGAGASVNAAGRGNGVFSGLGWSDGVGDQGTRAPSHAGFGTVNNGSGVHTPVSWGTYGSLYAPVMPGQQNREATVGANMTRGGGMVRISAASVLVDGRISADGISCGGGNSSGGSIWLTSAGPMTVTDSAVISARGAYDEGLMANAGASGGGRISLCKYMKESQMDALLASPNTLPDGVSDITDEFLALRPALANAVAPGAPAVSIPECHGTFKVLSGVKPGTTMLLIK